MENEKKSVELTIELVNEILNYLAKRPYIEVVNMINEITKQASK
jgi:hypothetical protein